MTAPTAVVVGAGAQVFDMHRPAFEAGVVRLVGVHDVDGERARAIAAQFACQSEDDLDELLARVRPDLAVVLTPHPLHAAIARRCLEAGAHVLVEKPLAVDVAEADELIAVAAACGRRLAVCLQQRLRPEVLEARRLIRAGELGAVQRVEVTQAWTRTDAYFRSPWRGQSGGAILTLAIHHLDLLYHLLGLPVRVAGWTANLLHRVAVEDTVQAMFEWGGGALGSLHVSSAEAATPERLELLGTAARIVLRPQELSLERFASDLREHLATEGDPYAELPISEATTTRFPPAPGHLGIYENLVAALRGEQELVADGREARASLELADALRLSGRTGADVRLV